MKNFAITTVLSLIFLMGLAPKNSFAGHMWASEQDTVNILQLNSSDTLFVCYSHGLIHLQGGYIDDGGCYDWVFPSGNTHTQFIELFDVSVEGFTNCGIGLTRCDGNNRIIRLIFVMPQTSSQNISICPGDSYTIGSHTYTTAGTYVDTIPAVNTCDSIVTTTLSINSLPTVHFTTDTIIIGSLQPVNLTPSITDANSYLWSTGETTASIIVDTVGWFYVTVSNNCGNAIDSVFIRLSTSLSEQINIVDMDVKVCPNPATDFIEISAYKLVIKKAEVFNQIGQLVLQVVDNSNLRSINVSMLPQGVYYLKLDTHNGTAKPIRFLKE